MVSDDPQSPLPRGRLRYCLAESFCLARKEDLGLADQEITKVSQQEPNNFIVHKSETETYFSLGRWTEYRSEIERFR